MHDTTIIIPTRNRRFLKRNLRYICDNNPYINIIVLDSSVQKIKYRNKLLINKLDNVTHIDHYNEDILLTHKLGDGVSYINTKYSLICADDDFVVIDGIKKSLKFLKENKNFICTFGDFTKFRKDFGMFMWKKMYPHQRTIDNDSESIRFHDILSNYMQVVYSLYRSEYIKKILKLVPLYTTDDCFGEILQAVLTVIYGKINVSDYLYGVRMPGAGKAPKIPEFKKNNTYNDKYLSFKKCILDNSNLSSEEIDSSWNNNITNDVINNKRYNYIPWNFSIPNKYKELEVIRNYV